MDEGDIIAQSTVKIDKDDDYITLEERLSKDGAELLERSVGLLIQEGFKASPQNHGDATYTSLISKEDGAVSFDMRAEDIYNTYRAFKKNPGVYIPLGTGNIKIIECVLGSTEEGADYKEDMPLRGMKVINNGDQNFGEILKISDEGIEVICDRSTIILKTLQPPNKKAMNARDFANGSRLKKGDKFK